ncbi:hypothetical protein GCM10011504_43730 [Siccirubricoccus deserti]|uniref:Tripartite tricarboxylate transporter substrate binding protein n=1 Tax=Siccirubricoccus deserti TaxID=2013562 RepID=A0A9X0R1G7_9PROT|nr:hypothetical protein [Siccirubricoccus deserti]GGC60724.1 hypothetical protein GCM10011504_43730 [Siccirubricoccus deserti]
MLFDMRTGAQLLHIRFRGAAEAQQAALSGNTDGLWDTVGPMSGVLRAGGPRGLGLSAATRGGAVPSVIEAGFPGLVATNCFLLIASAGLDPAIAAKLRAAVRVALGEVAARARPEASGVIPLGVPMPAEIAAFVAREGERWGNEVRTAGIRPG